MPNPILKVVIRGLDEFSDVADKAKEKASGFVASVGSVFKGLSAIVAAVGLAEFFRESVEEANKADLGMRRLGQAVTNTGGDFNELKGPLEDAVKGVMKVSTATDDDLRAALTNMIAISGNTGESMKNLGLAADVAAFKQISLEEASTLVAKAMTGNTKVLKEFGISAKETANPMEALRGVVGGFAAQEANSLSGKLTQMKNQWGEVKEAVGGAILQNGILGESVSTVVTWLGDLAHWVEENETQISAVVGTIGSFVGALFDVARSIYDAVSPALGAVAKLLLGTMGPALKFISSGVQLLAAVFDQLAAIALRAVGSIVTGAGKLLKVFGVDVVQGFGEGLLASAARFEEASQAMMEKSVATAKEGVRQSMDLITGHQTAVQAATARHEATVTATASAGSKARQAAAKEEADQKALLLRDVNILLTRSAEELNKELAKQPVNWAAIAGEVQRIGNEYRDLLPLPAALNDHSLKTKETVEQIDAALKDQQREWQDTAMNAGEIANGVIDAANGMGLLSDRAAQALGSVVNMGVSVAKMIGEGVTTGGILGVVGGLASLIGNWSSSAAERHRVAVMEHNSRVIQELTGEIGDMNLSASGKQFGGVMAALQGAQLPSGFINRSLLDMQLAKQGLTRTDLDKVAKGLGIDISSEAGLSQLLELMQKRGFKGYGTGFGDQLQAAKDRFQAGGVTDADAQLSGLSGLFGFSPAIAKIFSANNTGTTEGISGAKVALQALFTDFTNNKLTPEQLGGLNPSQFKDFVLMLLDLLGSADAVGGVKLGGTGSLGGGGGVATAARAPDFLKSLLQGMTGEGPAPSGADAAAEKETTGLPSAVTVTVNGDINATFPNVASSKDAEAFVTEALAIMDQRFRLRSTSAGKSISATVYI